MSDNNWPMRRKKEDNIKKLWLGITLLILGAILIFGQPKIYPVNSDYSFANEPVKVEGFKKSDPAVLPERIMVPALGVDLPVKEAKIINGYWEVFSDTAAWGKDSGVPGEVGNQVIFAHAREGLFLPLKDVTTGMRVYVLTDQNWYQYEVEEIKEVLPNQVEVIAPTEDETLTLYTCSGFRDSKRLIVTAKRAVVN